MSAIGAEEAMADAVAMESRDEHSEQTTVAGAPSTSGAVDAACVSQRFLEMISRDFARDHLVVSQGTDEMRERLAISETTDAAVVHNIAVILGRPVAAEVRDGEHIRLAIDEAYAAKGDSIQCAGVLNSEDQTAESGSPAAHAGAIDRLLAEADRDLLSTQGKGPVVKLVDALLFEALSRRASDVHVQPLADRTLVRYRLDGVLHTIRDLMGAGQLTQAIISRIKVMGRMDIAERRMPQDGRATVSIGAGGSARTIDLRISTLPTSYGERAVIRLLDNQTHLCDFQELGMPPQVAVPYLERSGRSNGILLLTGPTGSGKTTTLYSTLRQISLSGNRGLNVMTIEDPIEYELATAGLAISQAQVNPRKGITFATGLRHILRQDPDVVMVGEIRDAETARIAIQSSLTGHLVFSTLHTNDAASAITRLIDLGIEPYLASASLSAVLAQRLVRTLHDVCNGDGCEECLGTGFRGRTGLFELLVVTETIREQISAGAELAVIRREARRAGMRTLLEDGQRLLTLGRTREEEVRRVVHGAWEAEA